MTETKPRPFDERAALEQLEQLADKIQSTRRQRERAVAEFNAFVKTFKDDDQATRWSALQAVPRPEPRPPSSTTLSTSSAPPPAAPSAPLLPPEMERRTAEPAVAALSRPPVTVEPSATSAAPELEPEPASWSAPRGQSFDASALLRSPGGRLALAAAGVVILVLLVSWLWRGIGGGGAAGTPPAATAVPPVQKPAEPTPVASTGPDAAQDRPRRALNIVLMTSRPVWTRVTVDDRKVIEREIPAGETIPLGADRAIVIRAGDAGAVKVILEGKDLGVLGRDGQIASRAFTAPAAR